MATDIRLIWHADGTEGTVARKGKRYFGSLRTLPSGRVQARYTAPDGRTYAAPVTFDSRQYAEAFLARVHADIQADRWVSPHTPKAVRGSDFRDYATAWLAGRDLADRTRDDYAQVLRDHILPAFRTLPVTAITPAAVREWHTALKDKTGLTMRAHAYGLLRTIMNTAVADEVIAANPCRVRGGGSVKRAKKIRPASLPELEVLVKALPDKYLLMALLACWCGLRFGELAELRRSDIDAKNAVVHVRRGVVRVRGGRKVKGPKSEAGRRDVAIPPHLVPLVKDHLHKYVLPRRDALVFRAASGGHLAPATLYRVYYPAREAAGRPDLRFHDLRHTGAVLAAATGATLAELMARLGHSTAGAALRYQHAAADRDKVIAAALSKLAGGTVTPIVRAKSSRHKAAK
jgi:integrase